jgi:hypothetical protein
MPVAGATKVNVSVVGTGLSVTEVGETERVPAPSGTRTETEGEAERAVRVPEAVDCSLATKVCEPIAEGATAADEPPPAP